MGAGRGRSRPRGRRREDGGEYFHNAPSNYGGRGVSFERDSEVRGNVIYSSAFNKFFFNVNFKTLKLIDIAWWMVI